MSKTKTALGLLIFLGILVFVKLQFLGESRLDSLPAQVLRIVEQAEQLEIMALNPAPLSATEIEGKEASTFHGYPILGQAVLSDASTCEEVMSAVYQGIEDSEGSVAGCFNPRHGIRAESEGSVVDFVICFECLSMQIYHDGESQSVLTTEDPGVPLTRIWEAAGLTIHTYE